FVQVACAGNSGGGYVLASPGCTNDTANIHHIGISTIALTPTRPPLTSALAMRGFMRAASCRLTSATRDPEQHTRRNQHQREQQERDRRRTAKAPPHEAFLVHVVQHAVGALQRVAE